MVTIITPCFNTGEKYLRTLDSIKDQKYRNIELIIIDDASSDNSVSLIKNWSEENNYPCNLIVHTKNQGVCASLNDGLRVATGEFVTFIGDDIMLPDKIKDDVDFMRTNPDVGLCHSNLVAVYEESGKETLLKGKSSQNFFHDFFAWNIIIYTPTIFYRKKVFDEVGLFDESLLFEDFDFILRATFKFKIGYRDKTTVRYMKGTQKASTKWVNEMARQMIQVVKKWKGIKNYRYYMARRHLSLFYSLSENSKWASLRYMPRSLRSFSDKRLYRAFLNLFFKW